MASARSVPISHPWRETNLDKDWKRWEDDMDRKLEEDRRAFQQRVDEMDREFKRKVADRDFATPSAGSRLEHAFGTPSGGLLEHTFDRHPAPYWRRAQEIKDIEQRQRSGSFGRETSELKDLRDRIELSLDVKDYAPEDIKVTVHNNELKVEGKHEEVKETNGYKSKKVHEFSRKFALPSNINSERISSTLAGDGTLTIEAPKFALEGDRKIPVTYEKSG